MSRISENIRKITKAWGGKTTGNGISDALSDLYNNLPFGTKVETVEILPAFDFINADESNIPEWLINGVGFEKGKMYSVYINNTKYNCIADDIYDVDGEFYFGVGIGDTDVTEETPFLIIDLKNEEFKESTNSGMVCFFQLAEHLYASDNLVLSITTEQETVTPIPQKYLPEPVIFTSADEGETFTCNKTFAECQSIYKERGYCTAYVFIMGSTATVLSVSMAEEAGNFVFGVYTGNGLEYYILTYSADGTITV